VVYFYAAVFFCFKTHPPERTARAVCRLVNCYFRFVPVPVSRCFISCLFKVLSHGAYKVIVCCIIVQVFGGKSVFPELLFLLCMKIIVLYKSFHLVVFHKTVIFFAAISGIGNNCFGIGAVTFFPVLKKRNHGECIGRVREKIKMGNKLILGANLKVIGRFQLPILHMVVFQSHKSTRLIGFGITIPGTQNFKVVFVFTQLWKVLFFQCFDGLLLFF